MIVFSITVATHMGTSYHLKWLCATLFHSGHFLFKWTLRFETSLRSNLPKWNFVPKWVTSPELMLTLMMKLPFIKVKFSLKWNLKPISVHFASHENVLLEHIISLGKHCRNPYIVLDASLIWLRCQLIQIALQM